MPMLDVGKCRTATQALQVLVFFPLARSVSNKQNESVHFPIVEQRVQPISHTRPLTCLISFKHNSVAAITTPNFIGDHR
jgi:hypothetical protein